MAHRLTPPMVELLTDITTKPMYITRYSRWDQTAEALIRREMAYVPRGFYEGNQYEIRITAEGLTEAKRRGIVQ